MIDPPPLRKYHVQLKKDKRESWISERTVTEIDILHFKNLKQTKVNNLQNISNLISKDDPKRIFWYPYRCLLKKLFFRLHKWKPGWQFQLSSKNIFSNIVLISNIVGGKINQSYTTNVYFYPLNGVIGKMVKIDAWEQAHCTLHTAHWTHFAK